MLHRSYILPVLLVTNSNTAIKMPTEIRDRNAESYRQLEKTNTFTSFLIDNSNKNY